MNKLKFSPTLKLTVAFLFLLMTRTSLAYPHFVGFGYTSCLTCHYNPFGNGPLNGYGRALSASAVSGRSFYDKSITEEEIANMSSFLFSTQKRSSLHPSFDARGLLMKNNFGKDNESTTFIFMQADANIVYTIGKKKQLYFSGTIGYAPVPRSLKGSTGTIKKYRSREHYLAYRPRKNFGIYVGLMDKIFGIRVAEHTSYARKIHSLDQNDQSHGVQLHYTDRNFEMGLGGFMGNLAQERHLRQVGFSTKVDYIFSHKGTIGLSYMYQKNDYLNQNSAALHMKSSVGNGSSLLIELGNKYASSVLDKSQEATSATYLQIQNYVNLARGFFFFNSVEYMQEKEDEFKIRIGPGIQYFPIQRFELRADLQNTRSFNSKVSSDDSWDLFIQVHTWF